jgi:hypothetical protein
VLRARATPFAHQLLGLLLLGLLPLLLLLLL